MLRNIGNLVFGFPLSDCRHRKATYSHSSIFVNVGGVISAKQFSAPSLLIVMNTRHTSNLREKKDYSY